MHHPGRAVLRRRVVSGDGAGAPGWRRAGGGGEGKEGEEGARIKWRGA